MTTSIIPAPTAAHVPEQETYAMLLAGLGASPPLLCAFRNNQAALVWGVALNNFKFKYEVCDDWNGDDHHGNKDNCVNKSVVLCL